MESAKLAEFFLGANSPNGFSSYFSELNDPSRTDHCYVIKGCPGSGKSTMMKHIAASLADVEKLIEQIHCSSDPDSLDAVILHDSRAIIADGTLPHAIEPKLPIVYETIVSLYACFDQEKLLPERKLAMEIDQKIKDCHNRCCRYLAGAAMLLEDNCRTAAECTDTLKIKKLAEKLAEKEMPTKKGKTGLESKRLLSAVTPKGIISYHQTISTLCQKIYIVKDEYGASSSLLLIALKQLAIEKGYDVFACYSPLDPCNKLEHLLIPELSLGFTTQNSYLAFDLEPYRVIHFSRFTDKNKLRLKKQRLSFNKRAAREILDEAIKTLVKAKSLHDELEKIYGFGVDFNQIDAIQESVTQQIRSYYEL